MFTRSRLVAVLIVATIAVTISPARASAPTGTEPYVTGHLFEVSGVRNYSHPATSVPNTYCYDFYTVQSFVYSGTVFARPGFRVTAVCWRNYVIIPNTVSTQCYSKGPSGQSYIYLPVPGGGCPVTWGPSGQPSRSVSVDMDFHSPFDLHEVDIDIIYGRIEFEAGGGPVFSGGWVMSDYL